MPGGTSWGTHAWHRAPKQAPGHFCIPGISSISARRDDMWRQNRLFLRVGGATRRMRSRSHTISYGMPTIMIGMSAPDSALCPAVKAGARHAQSISPPLDMRWRFTGASAVLRFTAARTRYPRGLQHQGHFRSVRDGCQHPPNLSQLSVRVPHIAGVLGRRVSPSRSLSTLLRRGQAVSALRETPKTL